MAMSFSANIIMPEVMTLTKSPLLQGAALNAILLFFQTLVATNVPQFGYQELVTLLISPLMAQPAGTPTLTLHKQVLFNLNNYLTVINKNIFKMFRLTIH